MNISLECYDIDSKLENITHRDTLLNPPSYEGNFVLTNPPYLARNKAIDKTLFNLYNTNDLYKCFILSIIEDNPDGGIIIIPLNFLSSIRKSDIELRMKFLNKFDIIQINIFEEQVFTDTTYSICSIQFEIKNITKLIKIDIYPKKLYIETELNKENNYMLGGDIYNLLPSKKYSITRLTKLNKDNIHSNILAKCIDDNYKNQIKLSIVDIDSIYIDETEKLSSRTYATLIITPPISNEKQELLVYEFNKFLNNRRKKYNSLFLSNYRESKDIARKRISFGLTYLICNYLLDQIDLNDDIQ
jgi:hypothetical protein